jgi:hypothetical protein
MLLIMYRILVLTVHQLLAHQRLFQRRTESILNRRLLDREPAVRVLEKVTGRASMKSRRSVTQPFLKRF